MQKKMKNKVIIFDCDGTILDTFSLIEKTVYLTFEKLLPNYPLTKEEAHSFFGPLLDDSFKKYAKTEEELKNLIDCYRTINDSLMEEYITSYDGIYELLKALKEQRFILTIASNKVTEAVMLGLKICHLEEFFDLIIGAEKMKEPKPSPDAIYQILKFYNIDDAIMVGDTIIDIKTGQNANIKTIGVTWCKTKREEFIKNKATYVVDKPKEILDIVSGKYQA